MWICVGLRDPATKASRGCLLVVELSAIPPQLPALKSPRGRSYYKKKTFRFLLVGCCLLWRMAWRRMAGLVFLLVFWVITGARQRSGVDGFVVQFNITIKTHSFIRKVFF